MNEETLGKIFEFIKEQDKQKIPLVWKWSSGVPLTEEDLTFNGSLDLEFLSKKITSLPEGLHVDGILNIIGTNIAELPANLYVGLDFWIYRTPLADNYTEEQIRDILASTGGKIEGRIVYDDVEYGDVDDDNELEYYDVERPW
jgi:hypothetical protein